MAASEGTKRLRLWATALLLLSVGVLQVGWFLEVFSSDDPVATAYRDWAAFHRTAVSVQSHDETSIYPAELLGRSDGRSSEGLPFLYPPFVAVVILPLAFLTPLGAYLACAGAVGIGVVLAAWTLMNIMRVRSEVVGLSFLALIGSAPWNGAVIMGQLSALLVLAPALALLAWAAKRPILTGMALSLLLAKPNWGLPMLGLLLVGRQWRMVLGFLLGGTGLFAVSLPLGIGLWQDWLTTVLAYQNVAAAWTPPWKQATLRATLESLTGRVASDRIVFIPWLFAGSALMLGTALGWWRRASDPDRFPRLLGVGLLAILVSNPYAYYYDAVLLIPAAVLLWGSPMSSYGARAERWAKGVTLATYGWMLLQYFALQHRVPSLVGLGLAIWLMIELADLEKPRTPPPSHGPEVAPV